MDKVAFVGLGYIGLPTAVVMANAGVDVTGVDINQENVERINKGEVTIVEPGLEDALKKALDSGRFRATTNQVHADCYIIAVPTPFNDDHSIDMRFIYSAAEDIAPQLQGGELIILESTSPPLTTRKMAEHILKCRPDLKADSNENPEGQPIVYFAHCPERILPGHAMEELKTNDRIIGGQTPEATKRATAIYSTFCDAELLAADDITAEMAKLTENSFRDVNIAFANELSLIADNLQINIWELINLANHHPRVNILQPGPGVGGHCIAVDPWFIVSADPDNANLIRTAREVNDAKPEWVKKKATAAMREHPESSVGILGLAFKADIDDLRESPALSIALDLISTNMERQFKVVEPNISQLPPALSHLNNAELVSIDEALEQCDVVVLLVDHGEFKQVAPQAIEGKNVIDTRGIWTK